MLTLPASNSEVQIDLCNFSHYHGPFVTVAVEVGRSVESWHMYQVPLHSALAETVVLPWLQMEAVVSA